MAGAFRGGAGGIQSLLNLTREEWEALEADLLHAGYTLADVPGRVTWRALTLLVKAARPDSAFYAVTSTEETQWPRTDQLLAVVIDSVRDLTWVLQCVNTPEDKQAPERPERLPRPGVSQQGAPGPEPSGAFTEDTVVSGTDIDGTYGRDPIPASAFQAWWDAGGG